MCEYRMKQLKRKRLKRRFNALKKTRRKFKMIEKLLTGLSVFPHDDRESIDYSVLHSHYDLSKIDVAEEEI